MTTVVVLLVIIHAVDTVTSFAASPYWINIGPAILAWFIFSGLWSLERFRCTCSWRSLAFHIFDVFSLLVLLFEPVYQYLDLLHGLLMEQVTFWFHLYKYYLVMILTLMYSLTSNVLGM